MPSELNTNKDIYTTFEVARICNANITSIKNWIEKGKLRAFRTPGGHYRIERAVLKDFLDRYGMPNPFDDRQRKHVLIISKDPATIELVRRSLGRASTVEGTDDPLEAALLVGDEKPDCLVLDPLMDGFDGLNLVRKIRENPRFQRMGIVVYADSEDVDFEHSTRDAGVNHFVRTSEGIDTLTARVKEAIV